MDQQQEAVDKNQVPDSVQPTPMTPTQDHSKENEQAKDKLAAYGETDVEAFVAKVLSNAVYARKVVRHLLGLDANVPLSFATTSGAPQEHNITGKLVHTEFPPKVENSLGMNLDGSGSEKYGAGDWTQTKGEGLTDDTLAA